MNPAFVTLLLTAASITDEAEIESKYGDTPENIWEILQGEAAYDEEIENYTVETLEEHLDACVENTDLIAFYDKVRNNPAMSGAYSFLIAGGPSGVYGLIAMMGEEGVLDKKKVKETAKISAAKAATEKAFYKHIWQELSVASYEFMNEWLAENLEDLRKRFPEMDEHNVTSIKDILFLSQRTSLNNKVDDYFVEQTKTNTAISLGWRLDMHSAKRNGGYDTKTGELTEEGKERVAELAAKAEKASSKDEDSGEE